MPVTPDTTPPQVPLKDVEGQGAFDPSAFDSEAFDVGLAPTSLTAPTAPGQLTVTEE